MKWLNVTFTIGWLLAMVLVGTGSTMVVLLTNTSSSIGKVEHKVLKRIISMKNFARQERWPLSPHLWPLRPPLHLHWAGIESNPIVQMINLEILEENMKKRLEIQIVRPWKGPQTICREAPPPSISRSEEGPKALPTRLSQHLLLLYNSFDKLVFHWLFTFFIKTANLSEMVAPQLKVIFSWYVHMGQFVQGGNFGCFMSVEPPMK